ncbi:MAG: IMPACT family protein [Acinetobacter sp.]
MPFTIASQVSFEQDIKKSRFQAIAVPVENEQAVKDFLETHKDITTTHQCWAWKIGNNVRFNDDGEPSGTAGRPILASIEGNELSNILVLVNRWYGGIKLGTGGLVRAYGGCAGQCLLLTEKIELIEKKKVSFICQFNEWSIFQYELNQQQVEFKEDYTATGVQVEALLQIHQIGPLALKIQDVTRGREQLKIVEEPQDD